MLDYVQKLVNEEGMKVAPGVLPLVVRAGGGSPRDTLSLLDQLIAGSEGDEIGYERAVALLGYTHSALLDEVVEAMAAGDSATAFASIDRVIQTGQDPRRFVEDLLERLRDLIIIAAAGPEKAAAVLRGTPEEELERMGTEARAFGAAELSRIADIVNAALTEMSGATSPRLHLELMIARALVPSVGEAGPIARVERLERRVGVTDAAPKGPAAEPSSAPLGEERPRVASPAADERSQAASRSDRPAVVAPPPGGWATPGVTGVEAEAAAGRGTSAGPAGGPGEGAAAARPAGQSGGAAAGQQPPAPGAPQAAASAPQSPAKPVGPVTLQLVKDAWPQILEAVKAVKMNAWLVVVTATVRKYENDVLTLTFPSENDIGSFRPQPGATQNVSDVLREAIQKVLGVRVKFVAKTATDFAQSLKAEGFGITAPSAAPAAPAATAAPAAPATQSGAQRSGGDGASGPRAPQQVNSAPRAPQQTGAPRGAASPQSPASHPAPQPETVAPRLSAVPDLPKSDGPVTTWATVAIPGSGGAAAAPQAVEAPVVAERPKLTAVPPLPKESAPAAAPVDDDGWATAAPSDDDAPSFEEDPDAAPASSAGRVVPQPRAEAPVLPDRMPTPSASPAASGAPAGLEARPAAAPQAAGTSPAPRKGPSFSNGAPQRYGEAVVREILNARFVEEQQLPEGGR
jgi:DNA polymerase-3 subunit gamma/tau